MDIMDSPITLPSKFKRALQEQTDKLLSLRAALHEAETTSGVALEKTISNNFMDWLVQTEKSGKIIDLIKLDMGMKENTVGIGIGDLGGIAGNVSSTSGSHSRVASGKSKQNRAKGDNYEIDDGVYGDEDDIMHN